MGRFAFAFQAASAEARKLELRGNAAVDHIRKAVEMACGPLPIEVAGGRKVTDISIMTDGRPIYKLA